MHFFNSKNRKKVNGTNIQMSLMRWRIYRAVEEFEMGYILRKRVATCFLVMLIFGSMFVTVHASDATLGDVQFNVWSNGTTVKVESTDKKNQVNIDLNSQGLKEGIYTTYLYDNKNRDWSDYGELVFSVKNKSTTPLKINIVLELANGEKRTVRDNRAVFLQHKDEKMLDLVYSHSEAIELGGLFEGKIYVPFASLQGVQSKDTQIMDKISDLTVWGITVISEANQEIQFELGDFSLVLLEDARVDNLVSGVQIHGDRQIQKPIHGESIARYYVDHNDPSIPVAFHLQKPMDGAVVSTDGKITLTPSIQADQLQMIALIDDKWRRQFTVDLFSSWTVNAKATDGTSLAILDSNDMTKVISATDPFLNSKILNTLRIVVVAIGIGIGIVYWSWRRTHKA